ncbi:hypothetical protein BKA69DRAFT_1135916 [Paraphysoderma sedebokerense]|nr:hypothetical protein BKA69DRAFT_1135916 [Paraphysoderma sedebokerense]
MRLNIRKCGVIGLLEEEVLLLDGNEVPKVATYKYLGLPFGSLGIQWDQYVETVAVKAARHVDFLKAISYHWTPLIRLTVFKIFIRSRFDFALALLWSWCHSRGDTKFLALKPLEKLQNSIINWIFPSKHKERNLRLHGSILGLTPISFRAKSAAFFMAHRLRHLPPTHPISVSGRTLHQYPIPFPPKGYSVLRPLQNHNLLKLYLQTHPNAIPPKPLSPKTFILRQALQVFYSDPKAVLPMYISPKCRFNRYSYDSILRITDNKTREFALRWRRGIWNFGDAVRRRCNNLESEEGEHWFKRSCMNRCGILVDWRWNSQYVTEQIWLDFWEYKATNYDVYENFCFIDYVLNKKAYHMIPSLVHAMEEKTVELAFDFR